jgi:hypothetical protein
MTTLSATLYFITFIQISFIKIEFYQTIVYWQYSSSVVTHTVILRNYSHSLAHCLRSGSFQTVNRESTATFVRKIGGYLCYFVIFITLWCCQCYTMRINASAKRG